MKCSSVRVSHKIWLTSLLLLASLSPLHAQDYEDVFFSLRHPGISNYIIDALYYQDEFYFPVTEIFSVLEIYHSVDQGRFSVNGFFLSEDRLYRIDLQNGWVTLGDRTLVLDAEDYILTDFGYFLSAEVFENVFGMEFTIDMGNLMIHLRTEETMPVVTRIERERRRQRIERVTMQLEDYPEYEGRQRKWLDGGFLDYSLTGNIANNNNSYNYFLSGGAEVMGGDIQGNMTGSYISENHNYIFRDIRWRYVYEDNPLISRFSMGQLSSIGLHQRSFTGVQISNEPVRPRHYFDEYVMEGTVQPESEVEIYVNNQLYDFQYADEYGQYRFNIPLMYGTSQVRLMSYLPDGRLQESNRRVQVPFTFIPQGEFNYNLSGGQALTSVRGFSDLPYMGLANFGYGVSSWLTLGGGAEYYDFIHDGDVAYFGRASMRMFHNHLVSVDAAPGYYTSVTADALYANSLNWRLSYRNYDGLSIYNQLGAEQEVDANFFSNFRLGRSNFSYRLGANHSIMPVNEITRVSTDLNWRINRTNFRIGYRDSYNNIRDGGLNLRGIATGSILYTTSRGQSVPRMLRGMMIRGQLSYMTSRDEFERAELTLTKAVSRRGRFRFNVSHSFMTDMTLFEAGLVLDFNRMQSTSTARTNTTDYSFRQNIRGSIGFDSNDGSFHGNNRHQVGRSAASIRMFIDNSGSGTFEEGDQLINDNAVRLARVGGRTQNQEGVTRITHLLAYDIHNVEINQAMISNPLLIPSITEFSFYADPNAYKAIDIPFYVGGEVEGEITRIVGGRESVVSGMRVILEHQETGERITARTFSNGQFYATQIRPGQYVVKPDSSQLAYLNMVSRPEQHAIDIEVTPYGDIKTDLNFLLVPEEPEPFVPVEPDEPPPIADLTEEEQDVLEQLGGDMQRLLQILATGEQLDGVICAYRVTISSQVSLARTHIAMLDAESAFGRRFHTRYIGGLNAFAIISDYFVEEADAIAFRNNVQQAGYSDAFITEECRPFPSNLEYHIVFEDTPDEETALAASRRVQQQLGIAITVEYVEDLETYVVRSERTDHFSEILSTKVSALQLAAFDEVTIVMTPEFVTPEFQYVLQLAAFPNAELAEDFAVQAMAELNTELEVIRNFRTNLYEVRMLPEPNFGRAIRLRQVIQQHENYEAPVILTVTVWGE